MPETIVSVSAPVTVARLRDAISAAFPTFSARGLVAVNAEYADDDQVIEAGDEVALVPPVAGG